LHDLKTVLIAPVDTESHTYRLEWSANDRYAVYLDGDLLIRGRISTDFEGLQEPEIIRDVKAKKPNNWVDEPYLENKALLEKLEKMDKWIADPEQKMPVGANPHTWTPNRILNPDYLELELRADEMMANPKYRGSWEAPLIRNPKFVSASPTRHLLPEEIIAVGVEFKVKTPGLHIDNIYLSDEKSEVPLDSRRVLQ